MGIPLTYPSVYTHSLLSHTGLIIFSYYVYIYGHNITQCVHHRQEVKTKTKTNDKTKQKTKGRVIKQKLEPDWGKKADRESEEREDSTVVQTKGRESGSNWGRENKK